MIRLRGLHALPTARWTARSCVLPFDQYVQTRCVHANSLTLHPAHNDCTAARKLDDFVLELNQRLPFFGARAQDVEVIYQPGMFYQALLVSDIGQCCHQSYLTCKPADFPMLLGCTDRLHN